ncbi:MAG: hypothetical protein A2Y21_09060 [Clostridiales bacterium GWC2_40_7]|nr:MAG: hypothetical protein A2Y21_09060 [Clostridiales bacterium GWC2_40_7]
MRVLKRGFNPEYTGNNRRLLSELGGFKFTSCSDGVKQLYAYYTSKLRELDLATVRKDPYLKLCSRPITHAKGKI